MLRVVRLSNRTPSDCSMRVTHLLTTDVETFIRRAAAEKLRASTTRAKVSIPARSMAEEFRVFCEQCYSETTGEATERAPGLLLQVGRNAASGPNRRGTGSFYKRCRTTSHGGLESQS